VLTKVPKEPSKKGKLHFPPRVKCTRSKTVSRMLNVYKRLIINRLVGKLIFDLRKFFRN